MRLLVFFLSLAATAAAGEFLVLENGYRLYVDRHEVDGGTIRWWTGGGSGEFAASRVVGVEKVEEPETETPAPAAATSPVVAVSEPPGEPHQMIEAAARRYGLPAEFLHSVVAAESAYRADAVSPKGAIGLMQLMPDTARAYGADPWNPKENIEAGTAYLRDLLLRYQDDSGLALAAYNAGPGAVNRYNGIPPYAETRTYVNRVIRHYRKLSESVPRPKGAGVD